MDPLRTTVGSLQSFGQIGSFLRGLGPRPQLLLGLSAVVVGGVLWVFVGLVGGVEYRTLYAELSPAEAQSIAQRLAVRNIAYQLSEDGTGVLVPADRLDALRLEMAAQGLPHSGRLGFELFDKPNWAGSDFAEKVNYQRALEGELERTIQSLEQVESVRVHLVMPRESLFTEREREAKAAVVVKLRGPRLAEEATVAISHLVSRAVDNLRPEEVTVINADSRIPLLPPPRGGVGAPSRSSDLEQSLAGKLIATLSPLVGPEGVRATVTVEYDWSSSEQTQEIYDPDLAAPLSTQQSEEQRAGTLPGGIPGTASNVPAAKPPETATMTTAGAGESQVLRNESKTFAVSKTVRHVVDPPGKIKRISTAVLVDDVREVSEENGQPMEKRRPRTPEEIERIQELARGAVGFNDTRGDHLTVENISFETPPPVELPPPTALQRVRRVLEEWRVLLRYLALALLFGTVYWLVLRPIKRQVLVSLAPQAAALAPVAGAPRLVGTAAQAQVQTPKGPAGELEPTPLLEPSGGSAEAKQAVMLKRTLADKVKKDPAGASRLIQNWIRQDEEQ